MFKITSKNTAPPNRSVYPWTEMKVGDSFDVPLQKAESVRSAASARGRDYGEKYITRTVDDIVRVWRVE